MVLTEIIAEAVATLGYLSSVLSCEVPRNR
jgi:hypothetical protein